MAGNGFSLVEAFRPATAVGRCRR